MNSLNHSNGFVSSYLPDNRIHNRVFFTIGGDSSDCDSVTTTNSGSVEARHDPSNVFLEGEEEETSLNLDNAWRNPYHYQMEEINQNEKQNGSLKRTKVRGEDVNDEDNDSITRQEDETDRRRSVDSDIQALSQAASTDAIIPNFPNESLARLADVSSEDEEEEGNEQCVRSCVKTWGKWRILVACAMVQLFSALMVSLQAPFYPAEAEKKGCSASSYGFVFGVFELTVFFVAPFYGSRIHNWNPKLVFHIGIFTAAISSIAFGILDEIPNGKIFIAASALIRALEALGESAVITSSFIIVASAFPNSVASTFALVETFYSIGLITGPFVGSIFYEIGGFTLPFLVVGGLLLAAAVLSFLILPSKREISELQESEAVIISSYKSFRLLGKAGVALSALCIVLGALSISFLQATLQPHLNTFGITQLTTGAILIINGGVYTISAPFWGLLCDKVVQLKLVGFCGAAVLVCGYALIGPIPLFHFEQKLWILSIGLTLQGLGLGALLVSSFVSILHQVVRQGLPDTPSTYGLVSSLWTSMFSLGSFIGPSLSGVLYDSIGFANSTYVVIGFAFLMMCLLVIFMFISDSEVESYIGDADEIEPLLNNSMAISGSVYSTGPQPTTSQRAIRSRSRFNWGTRNEPRSSYGSI